jgi:hypothetical protein
MPALASKSPAGKSDPAPAIASHCRISRREDPAPDSWRPASFWSSTVVIASFHKPGLLIGAASANLQFPFYFHPTGNLHLTPPVNNAKVNFESPGSAPKTKNNRELLTLFTALPSNVQFAFRLDRSCGTMAPEGNA